MRCTLGAVVLAGCVLAACSRPAPKKADAPEKAGGVLPAALFVEAAPDGAVDVGELRASSPKAGDQVVVRGVVGGSTEPFVSGMALFTLVGSGPKPCNATPDDECPTPWDYCCESRAVMLASMASIRVVDDAGATVRAEIKGSHGIRELSELVIAGVVSQVGENVLVIDAESISVVKP